MRAENLSIFYHLPLKVIWGCLQQINALKALKLRRRSNLMTFKNHVLFLKEKEINLWPLFSRGLKLNLLMVLIYLLVLYFSKCPEPL